MARCCLPQERRAKRPPRPQWLERSRSLARADNVSVMSPRADAQGRWEVCFAVEPDRRKRPGSIETHGGDRRDDYFRNHNLLVIVHGCHWVSSAHSRRIQAYEGYTEQAAEFLSVNSCPETPLSDCNFVLRSHIYQKHLDMGTIWFLPIATPFAALALGRRPQVFPKASTASQPRFRSTISTAYP